MKLMEFGELLRLRLRLDSPMQQSLEVGHLNQQSRIYINDTCDMSSSCLLVLTNYSCHRISCLQDEVAVWALNQLQRLGLGLRGHHGGRGSQSETGGHWRNRGRELGLQGQLRRLGGDLSNVERDRGRLRGH